MKRLPIGVEDFKKMIDKNFYYIDKTDFINDVLHEEVVLYTRPRRFGKTLNMSCLLYTSKKITDVLPSRRMRYLVDYFHKIPLKERKKVKYVSFDMWKTYREVSRLMFPECICIVDKFHRCV